MATSASTYARSLAGAAGGQRLRPLRFVVRRLLAVGVDVEVDVRSERQRDAPVRHRRRGIELGGPAERADRLVVIERVDERQALIEELLRLGAFRGDRMVQPAEARRQRRRRRGRRGVLMLLCLNPG